MTKMSIDNFSYGLGIWIALFSYGMMRGNVSFVLASFLGIVIMFYGLFEKSLKKEKKLR